MNADALQQEMARMPAQLRALLEAEIAAGNRVDEIGHSFPAPPAGAFFKLARPLLSRPRASGGGITYYSRNSSLYSGEITDATRFYFLLEPPAPPPPEPDMDAIRIAQAPVTALPDHQSLRARALKDIFASASSPAVEPDATCGSDLVTRFRASMHIDYEKWHDGIGYDLRLIAGANDLERRAIEKILLARGTRDWRDVEALAALDTPATRQALRAALRSADPAISVAVVTHAPKLLSQEARTRSLVKALRSAEIYGGLTQALDQAEDCPSPKIVAELFRGALERDGGVAGSFASALLAIHGKISARSDWSQRPLILRFSTADRDEREAAFLDLCEFIGQPAFPFAEKVRRLRQRRTNQEKRQARIAQTSVPVFDVEIDTAQGRLVYREPSRYATVSCSFTGAPKISVQTLSHWKYTPSQRTRRMSDAEKSETLGRIMDYCRNRHGLLDLQRED